MKTGFDLVARFFFMFLDLLLLLPDIFQAWPLVPYFCLICFYISDLKHLFSNQTVWVQNPNPTTHSGV